MSERDRLAYLDKVAPDFPAYFSFCYAYRDQHPDLIGKMYDLLLWEKGMVASSVAAQRARLVTSGNSQTLTLLDQLMSRRNQLAVLSRSPALNLEQWQQVYRLRGEANALESELTRRSASIAKQTNLKQPSWAQVRDRLKKNEAAVEFVRFNFTDGKKSTGKAYYAALVVTPTTAQPRLVQLGESKDLVLWMTIGSASL